MVRALLSLALVASASAFTGVAPAPATSRLSLSRVARTPAVEMQEASKATIIGAASVGGILGVYFFHELQSGLILACIPAYAATTQSKFGEYSKTAGDTAVKVYDKTLELNAQYDLLPKASRPCGPVCRAAVGLRPLHAPRFLAGLFPCPRCPPPQTPDENHP